MEMEENKRSHCPVLDVDGVISGGKQFDLDITLPEDNRDVIYGVVKNCFKEPVKDAVVKLVEVVYEGKKQERRPVGHTFTGDTLSIIFFINSSKLLIFHKFVCNLNFLPFKKLNLFYQFI